MPGGGGGGAPAGGGGTFDGRGGAEDGGGGGAELEYPGAMEPRATGIWLPFAYMHCMNAML
jgi:hypothetical protein